VARDEVESVVREANRHIRAFAFGLPPGDTVWEFFCQCGCLQRVEMTLAEFDAAEAVYAPGHEAARDVEVLAALWRKEPEQPDQEPPG
jgi:hypothetical protein